MSDILKIAAENPVLSAQGMNGNFFCVVEKWVLTIIRIYLEKRGFIHEEK